MEQTATNYSNKKARPGEGWATTVFQMKRDGLDKTFAVPNSMHKISCDKLCDYFETNLSIHEGVVLLEGGEQEYFNDTDGEPIFKQNSWFNYLFGVKEPGFYGAIDISNKKRTLMIPRLPTEYQLWCGKIQPPEYFQELYGVDEIIYTDEMIPWLKDKLSCNKSTVASPPPSYIYLLKGLNTDSGLTAKPARLPDNHGLEAYLNEHDSILHLALSTIRVTKSSIELQLLKYCNLVASNAHIAVMRSIKAGQMEYELEALFQHHIYKHGGCRHVAYTSICACGPNAATLHYGHAAAPNDGVLKSTDMALLDMGANYHGYCSDITCSYPVSGKYTEVQRAIYESVLKAQKVVYEMMRPGVAWPECHKAAERAIVTGLLNLGVLCNGTVDELIAAEIGPVFFPHGLGHLIGCDTHDVGGYIAGTPSRPTRDGLKKLRTARVLQEGMVLTVEPGCYFIDYLLDQACASPSQSKYIDQTRLTALQLRGWGGVRLEDDVAVTSTGIDNFTTCPRLVEEVESVMSGGPWPPATDKAPYLCRRWCQLSPCASFMEAVIIPTADST